MGRKILVVDDEPYILRALDYVLKKERYEVTTAVDGEEALKRIEECRPDLILLDIMMPKIDGYELTRTLKSNTGTKDIYIILLTAKGQEEDHKKGIELGAEEYLTKPFSPSGLVKRLNEIFKEREC